MPALSDLLGRPVVGTGGRRIGRLADLAVRLGEPQPAVSRLRVRAGRAVRDIPWRDVVVVERRAIRVGPDGGPELPADGEIFLARDVLDQQVLDAAGRHLARVAEVELVAEGPHLRLVAIDVGLRPVLRRLGLGRLAGRAHERRFDWSELRLTFERDYVLRLIAPVEAKHRPPRHRYGKILHHRRRAPS